MNVARASWKHIFFLTRVFLVLAECQFDHQLGADCEKRAYVTCVACCHASAEHMERRARREETTKKEKRQRGTTISTGLGSLATCSLECSASYRVVISTRTARSNTGSRYSLAFSPTFHLLFFSAKCAASQKHQNGDVDRTETTHYATHADCTLRNR